MKKEANSSLIEKAAQQLLCEFLGYDEGRVYYLILIKDNKTLNAEFSHSKKYRLFKSLFNLGYMGKIKPESQGYFNYILLPSSFLYSSEGNKEIILFLDNLYLENHFDQFSKKFSQLIFRDEKNLINFLLRCKMKDNAKLIINNFNLDFLGEKRKNVTMIQRDYPHRKLGLIDKNIGFEFIKIRNIDSHDYIGYLALYTKREDNDFISSIEQEINGSKLYS